MLIYGMEGSDSKIDKYDEEFELDITHDMTTLSTQTLKHPNIYHKWVVRLRRHEWNCVTVSRKMEDYINKVIENEKKRFPSISETKLRNKVLNSEDYIKAKRTLEDEQHIVEHLKRYLRILDQMGFNFKISTEHYKLELAPQ